MTTCTVYDKEKLANHFNEHFSTIAQNLLKEGKASSWDYVQKIKNNLKHVFTKFHQLMT